MDRCSVAPKHAFVEHDGPADAKKPAHFAEACVTVLGPLRAGAAPDAIVESVKAGGTQAGACSMGVSSAPENGVLQHKQRADQRSRDRRRGRQNPLLKR